MPSAFERSVVAGIRQALLVAVSTCCAFCVAASATAGGRAQAATTENWLAIAAQSTRIWTDDSGKFQLPATLAYVSDDKICLRKENGRFVTVDRARLSSVDREIVAAALAPSTPVAAPAASTSEVDHTAKLGPDVLRIRISADLLQRVAEQKIQETRDVRETILCRPTFGTSLTTADLRVSLIPDADQARVAVDIAGNVQLRTTCPTPLVHFHARGLTDFTKRVWVAVSDRGFQIQPDPLVATSRFCLSDMTTHLQGFVQRLVLHIAERQYWRQKDASDAESAAVSRRRIDESIERFTQELLTNFRSKREKVFSVVTPTAQIQALQLRLNSSQDALGVAISKTRSTSANQADPAAKPIAEAPSPMMSAAPLIVQVHKSILADEISNQLAENWQKILALPEIPLLQTLIDKAENGQVEIQEAPDQEWITVYWSPTAK